MTGDIDISNWSFCYFEQFKADIHFANFGQVKTVPIFFSDYGQVTVTLLSLGKTCCGKQSKPSPFDLIKNQEPCIGFGASYFQ